MSYVETVIQALHNHVLMIDLNPLVIHRAPCKAPRFASAEEYFSTWYILKDKVQYIPGSTKMSGDVSYHACFHDLPLGLQTHVYAPLGLDIKNKWTLGESKPGEAVELGLEIPKQGLWLREDVDMRCNVLMAPFVKKTLKKAHGTLVDRLVELSHLTESVKSERTSLSSNSYGSETLTIGENSLASVSTGSLPLSTGAGLTPQLTNSSTISSASAAGDLHPSHIHPAFRPPAPAYAPLLDPSYPQRPSSAYRAYSSPPAQQQEFPGGGPAALTHRDSYNIPSPRPPGFFAQGQGQGYVGEHVYSKQYEAMRNRAQQMQNHPGEHVAELPAGSWVPEGRDIAELPG